MKHLVLKILPINISANTKSVQNKKLHKEKLKVFFIYFNRERYRHTTSTKTLIKVAFLQKKNKSSSPFRMMEVLKFRRNNSCL